VDIAGWIFAFTVVLPIAVFVAVVWVLTLFSPFLGSSYPAWLVAPTEFFVGSDHPEWTMPSFWEWLAVLPVLLIVPFMLLQAGWNWVRMRYHLAQWKKQGGSLPRGFEERFIVTDPEDVVKKLS
jgi:hypothetical protein